MVKDIYIKKIEFSNGCYDYIELSDYIKETLIANDDLEPVKQAR